METRVDVKFPKEVCDQLGYYVYRLIDPRSGETFYVGKGKDNRVFSHAMGDIDGDDLDEKMRCIRAIRAAGLEVGHVIHRHGMDEQTAFEVEAALIDAYPSAKNSVNGQGNADFGVAHTEELMERYSATPAKFEHKALMINVSKSALESSIYDAVRFAWRIDVKKAKQAEIILAVNNGLIIGVFIADEWLPATADNFPGRETVEGRYGFSGREAPRDLQQQYLRKKVPNQFRKKGAANPIKYTW